MGRSFVLRQPGGAMAGYLVTSRETLKLRASGIPAAGGELTLMDAQGVQSRRPLQSTQQEQTLGGTGGEIAAAYALGGGRVIFATDGQALRAAARALEERRRTQAEESAARRASPVREAAHEQTAGAGRHSGGRPAQEMEPSDEERAAQTLRAESRRREELLAQRRWPPPPCLTGARYAGGRWVTATQSDTPAVQPRCDAT